MQASHCTLELRTQLCKQSEKRVQLQNKKKEEERKEKISDFGAEPFLQQSNPWKLINGGFLSFFCGNKKKRVLLGFEGEGERKKDSKVLMPFDEEERVIKGKRRGFSTVIFLYLKIC